MIWIQMAVKRIGIFTETLEEFIFAKKSLRALQISRAALDLSG